MKHRFILRAAAVLSAAVMSAAVFTGCGKGDEEVVESTYSGVLTKIRLGMPQNKVIALNNQEEMYYESDTKLWCVNPDTDIMEVKALIPEDSQHFYCDDSLITYEFEYNEGEDEYYLDSYMEEVVCLIDKNVAKEYYDRKLLELSSKYGATEYNTTQTGTDGVDMNLVYETVMSLSSFSVTTSMTYTYDTVDGKDDYYCTHLSIAVQELENKEAVEISSASASEEGK